MNKRLMKIKTLAEYLDTSPETVKKKVREGALPEPKFNESRFVRWDRLEVDAALGAVEDPIQQSQRELMESLK